MKKVLVLLAASALFFVGCDEYGTNSRAYKNLVNQSEEMAKAFKEGNNQKFIDYNNDKIVELIGGDEQMMALLQEQHRNMQAANAEFTKVEVGKPTEIIDTADQLQSTVQETIEISIPNGEPIANTTTLVAISTDDGKTWQFADATGATEEEINNVLPNLSSKIKQQIK